LANVVKLSDDDAAWIYPELGRAEIDAWIGASQEV
jgi:hypothetical protein